MQLANQRNNKTNSKNKHVQLAREKGNKLEVVVCVNIDGYFLQSKKKSKSKAINIVFHLSISAGEGKQIWRIHQSKEIPAKNNKTKERTNKNRN